MLTCSLEHPLVLGPLDGHGALLVETDATGVEDGGGEDRVRDGREPVLVVLAGLGEACVHAARCVDELLDRDVAVAALAVEVPALRRRVLHAVGRNE